jgi:hypothetical protein
LVETTPTTENVYPTPSPRRDKPSSRLFGESVPRPLFDRCNEGLVKGLFGKIEVPEKAHESSEYTA